MNIDNINEKLYKENKYAEEALKENEYIKIKGVGNSMTPILKNKQTVLVQRINKETQLEKNDIIFCKVGPYYYLHKIISINKDRYQIGNNHGHVNGWIGRENIFAKVIRILKDN
jgi:aspartyl-tRNA synthetase